METQKSSRRRGAQPGNSNSLKHGFYSAQFQPAEQTDLRENAPSIRYSGLQDEIDLLRVFLRRTIERVNAEKDITVETQLRALDVISKASARLAHLMSVHHLVTVKIPSKEEAQLYQDLLRMTRRSANLMLEAAHLKKLGPSQREKDRQLMRELDEILGPYQPPPEPPSPSKPSRPRHKKSAPPSSLPVGEGRLPLGPESETEGSEGGSRRRGRLRSPCVSPPTAEVLAVISQGGSGGRRPEAVESPENPPPGEDSDELSGDTIPRESSWLEEDAFEAYLASQ